MTLGMVKPPVEPWCVAVAPVSREVLGPDAGEPCSSRSQAFSGCKKPRWESTVLSSQQLQSAASFRRDWESNAAQSQ
ncbi:Nitrate reductase [NADH] 1 [Dissostichus eleginoides]|uniref:Nitrate reductase [NADH] 1 n=1 Tax=Dissostichus eleginoides TaxID=100907 RepID=A0AAD9C9Z1_DISEL|nr:Nitrate reductase [NADH] 1 [Dissostichus eleginoides]